MKKLQDIGSGNQEAANTVDHEGPIGTRLLASGKLSDSDVTRIITAQKEHGLLFGEAAVSLGLVTQSELQRALANQYAYPYAERGISRLSPALVAAYETFGSQSESVRALRSQLSLRWFNDRRKIVAITAPRNTQGASTIAGNLAISFAQLGERTLLIDANLRTPRQNELFGLSNDIGLSGVLAGRTSPNSAFANVASFKNLFVMCAGPPPLNPQELLGRIGFSYFIETAPAAFDIIIVDTPPILEFADAQLIIGITQGCLLAIRRNFTTLADIELAKTQIEPTGAILVGAVLSD